VATIIDLGNGYGMLRGYASPYASLIFPLSLSIVRRLHCAGYLSDNEAIQTLLNMGCDFACAKWVTLLDSVTIEQWEARLPHGRTT